MPCNNIVTNTVELEHAGLDQVLLKKALEARYGVVNNYGLPKRPAYSFAVDNAMVLLTGGKLEGSLSQERLGEIVGEIKQSYGKECVKFAAKRFAGSHSSRARTSTRSHSERTETIMADLITGKTLLDGRIKTVTGDVSAENHQSAEAFFKMLATLTGGKETRESNGAHAHQHNEHHHGHEHHHGA